MSPEMINEEDTGKIIEKTEIYTNTNKNTPTSN